MAGSGPHEASIAAACGVATREFPLNKGHRFAGYIGLRGYGRLGVVAAVGGIVPRCTRGEWFKDFGSFRLCGSGPFPKTFLLKG
jgi:hypothetical protein